MTTVVNGNSKLINWELAVLTFEQYVGYAKNYS